jgi:hypothetical protein
MAGNAQALPAARATSNVNGRFVPRSARCILIFPASNGRFFLGRTNDFRPIPHQDYFLVADGILRT